jgi:hypothetical protein
MVTAMELDAFDVVVTGLEGQGRRTGTISLEPVATGRRVECHSGQLTSREPPAAGHGRPHVSSDVSWQVISSRGPAFRLGERGRRRARSRDIFFSPDVHMTLHMTLRRHGGDMKPSLMAKVTVGPEDAS